MMDDDALDYLPEENPILGRAHEAIARADAALATPRPEPVTMWQAQRGSRPWHERGLTIATMTQAQFSDWVDAGRPSLTPPQSKPQASPSREEMRAHVEKRFNAFAAIIGEEVAKAEKELRAEFERKLELVQSAQRMALGEVKADLETRDPWPARKKTAKRNSHVGPH